MDPRGAFGDSRAYADPVDVLLELLPTAGVTFLFVLGMRAIFLADRRERVAHERLTGGGPSVSAGEEAARPDPAE